MIHTKNKLCIIGYIFILFAILFAGISFLQKNQTEQELFSFIFIAGLKSEIFLFCAGLILFGLSLIGNAFRKNQFYVFFSNICLSCAVFLFFFGSVEWYFNRPNHLSLILPPEIAEIENRYVEENVGLRPLKKKERYKTTVPNATIPWIRTDPQLLKDDQQEVEIVIDDQGFCNQEIPAKTDIVTLGDSFTMGTDVKFGKSWVEQLKSLLHVNIYNLGVGGYGVSQEVEIYRRYGNTGNPWGVILAINGINDLVDEDNYAQFLASGMSVKEWLCFQYSQAYPRQPLAILQWFYKNLIDSRLTNIRGLQKPKTDLSPIRVDNSRPSTFVSYYPHYQPYAYNLAKAGPDRFAPVNRMVASLKLLVAECKKQNRVLHVLYFPMKQTIYPPSPLNQKEWLAMIKTFVLETNPDGQKASPEKFQEIGAKILQADEILETYLATVCKTLNVPFFSVRQSFQDNVRSTGQLLYYHFDIHWNEKGNTVAAQSIHDWIANMR